MQSENFWLVKVLFKEKRERAIFVIFLYILFFFLVNEFNRSIFISQHD